MKNHISPVNHPESLLSGSTIQTMIDHTKKLEIPYFAVTDHGFLASVLKGYAYAQNKGIKLIAGVELYFKDDNCDIIKNSPSEQIKYFKLVVHAQDQVAYQAIVRLCSDGKRKKVLIGENYFPLFNWNDIKTLAQYNITVCTSNIEGMVSKHLLVNRADLSVKYYQKIKQIVGAERFYPTILPFKHDKYWNAIVKVTLGDGDNTIEVDIPASDRIETNHFHNARAIELTKRNNKHKLLQCVYIDKVRCPVATQYQTVIKAKLVNEYVNLPEDIQTKANRLIIALAHKFGDSRRLLINNNSYYAEKEDKIVQDMKLGDEKRVYQSQYIATIDDVKPYLKQELGLTDENIAELVDNSYNWAKNFDKFELKYDYKLTKPKGEPKKLLVDIIKKVGRMKWKDARYVKQLRQELELLSNNGVLDLIPYFLPIVDVYSFYNKNGYLTGPARGSAGGFLISYLIGITHIDPIKFELSTARFLTLDRVQQGNLPDIDCDLESRVPLVGTDGNSGYLFEKYGDNAAQVSTRTLLRIKSAMLDVNRFTHGKVEESIAALAKSLPNTPQGVSDHDFVFGYEDADGNHKEGLIETSDDLQVYATERPKEWEIVKRSLSLSRQNSRHACAYVVSDEPISNTVPIFEVGGVKRVTQPEAKQCEWAGLIKYDFLVVNSLKDIRLCLQYINNKNKDKFEPIGWLHPESDSWGCMKCDPDIFDNASEYDEIMMILPKTENALLPCQQCGAIIQETATKTGYFKHNDEETYIWDLPEDAKVFDMLGEGHTGSVFQLNTVSVTPFVKKIKPKKIIDCATITSLVRPGPLDFVDPETGRNMAEEYIYRRHGMSHGNIKELNDLLPETYGILVFQEQVSKIAKELGNMSVEDAENVRIGMGKKKIKLLNSLKPKFIEGASKNTNQETAEKIWSMMATFAGYGFNKSHAVAYSVISYACAFLKYHYPLEWWAAVLSNAPDKEINEVFYKYVKDMVLPPDINTSSEQMEIDYDQGKIRSKLSIITGIGKATAEKIIENRPYKNIEDFIAKKVCSSPMTKKLIHVGVLDSLFDKGTDLLGKIHQYEQAVVDVSHNTKIAEYDKKIANAQDAKTAQRFKDNKERFIKKGKKTYDLDPLYLGLTPKKDFLVKKSIFPTINLNLQKILDINSSRRIISKKGQKFILNTRARENLLVNGETLQRIDNSKLTSDAYFCVPAYILDSSEFTYKNGARKALKLILDSSGYVSEKVLWPDYDTGELIYPEGLKKGCIAYFFYSKKAGKPYTNIIDVIVEEKSII